MDKLKNNKFRHFVNVIGGHSFIIKFDEKLLYKSTTENEIAFYEYVNRTFENSKGEYDDVKSLIPKYYGLVNRQDGIN